MSDDTKEEKTETETETSPKAEPPTPPAPPVERTSNDELKGMVEALQEEVTGLRTLVENVVNDGDAEMDSSPAGKPWTHWGKSR